MSCGAYQTAQPARQQVCCSSMSVCSAPAAVTVSSVRLAVAHLEGADGAEAQDRADADDVPLHDSRQHNSACTRVQVPVCWHTGPHAEARIHRPSMRAVPRAPLAIERGCLEQMNPQFHCSHSLAACGALAHLCAAHQDIDHVEACTGQQQDPSAAGFTAHIHCNAMPGRAGLAITSLLSAGWAWLVESPAWINLEAACPGAGCVPEGSLEPTPESLAWYSLVPALVCALEVGARPKRPAARNRAVEPIMICRKHSR